MATLDFHEDGGPKVLTQEFPAGLMLQSKLPPGATAPVGPETVALKVMVPPKSGVVGDEVTVTVGVVEDTTSGVGVGVETEE